MKNLEILTQEGVEQLASEVAPEVKYFIYSYFDTQVKRYNPPFVEEKAPAIMVDGLKNGIIKGVANPQQFVGLEFCVIGTFELSSGTPEFFEKPKHIADLSDMFEKYGGLNDGKVC